MDALRLTIPSLFLSRSERKILKARIERFEKTSDCEFALHVRRHFAGDDALLATRALFFKFGLEKTKSRTAILLAVALSEHKYAIWADEGVVRRSTDQLFRDACEIVAKHLKKRERLSAIIEVLDLLEKTLAVEQPASPDNKNELSNEPIIE